MGVEYAGSVLWKAYPSGELFEGLDISRSHEYLKHLNQYNVIHFSMNELPGRENTYRDYIGRFERNIRNDIWEAYPGLDRKELGRLSDLLMATEDEFIFIIDEWDYIFSHDIYRDNQGDFLEFLRDLLKDKPYVALVYMTGVLPIKKYSTGGVRIPGHFPGPRPEYLSEGSIDILAGNTLFGFSDPCRETGFSLVLSPCHQ